MDASALDALLPAETAGPAATLDVGERLAAALQPGDVVALHGDLGAGKTHLTKGLARGLGIEPDDVTSPTFTLVQEHVGWLPLYHVDLYRIERPEELATLGLDEILEADGICVIEWPERAAGLLPPHTLHLRLTALDGDRRRIERERPGG